jgi:hypothetical protein
MATAVIPILTAVLPEAVPIVVRLVEKIFGGKTVPAKLDAATEIVAAIQNGLQNTKQLSGQALDGKQIATLVQAAVDRLNATGALQGTATAIETGGALAATVATILEQLSKLLKG